MTVQEKKEIQKRIKEIHKYWLGTKLVVSEDMNYIIEVIDELLL